MGDGSYTYDVCHVTLLNEAKNTGRRRLCAYHIIYSIYMCAMCAVAGDLKLSVGLTMRRIMNKVFCGGAGLGVCECVWVYMRI